MHRGRDHEQRREVDEQEAAVEHREVVAVVDVGNVKPWMPKRCSTPNDASRTSSPTHAGDVEREARPAAGYAADAVRREVERERGAEQQAGQPRERGVVREVDADVREISASRIVDATRR